METNTNLFRKRKNLLFFIGNGFDINLGLPTAYTDFLKWYSEQPVGDVPSAKAIERIKEELKKDLAPDGNKLWADMEKYLGERLTDELLVNEVPEDSIHVKEDIDSHLKTYLKEINSKFSYYPYQTAVLLQDIVRMKIRLGLYPANEVFFSQFYDTLRFVDFNYTDTLDRIVGKWGEVLHIHGRIDNLILGVDAERQIPGDNYADETELIKKYVKQENIDAKLKEKWKKWIKEADCICFFGVSFGMTDRTYWKEVINSKSKTPLAIFEFDPQHKMEENLQKKLQGVNPKQKIAERTTSIPTGFIGDFWSALNPLINPKGIIDENRDLDFKVGDVKFKMVYVEGGTFTMGATPEQGSYAFDNEKPLHSVTLSSYYMGETQVTQALWQAVTGSNPSKFIGKNLPVEMVSWNDCQKFINELNRLCADQLKGKRFALPTEAEWEYAARGGKKSKGYKYSGSNNIDDVAWYDGNSGGITHEVCGKLGNELGLFDMSGNVWEWCKDWYERSYSSSAQTDPAGPATGSDRVRRGGSWSYNARYCRVSSRFFNDRFSTYYGLGLRLSLH